MILRPENPLSNNLAKVTVSGEYVLVGFPQANDVFIRVCKDGGYTWSRPNWVRKIAKRAGPVDDRMAEIASRLLSVGFPVEIEDETLANKVISGDYTPEHTRWVLAVTSGEYKGWFALEWARREDFYHKARDIRGSRYCPPNVVIPTEQYEQVLDFAAAHDFKITVAARELADEARRKWEAAVLVAPVKPKKPKPAEASTLIGVADELKDEPL